jgi:hypothetical protein
MSEMGDEFKSDGDGGKHDEIGERERERERDIRP